MQDIALLGGGGLALELVEYMMAEDIKIAGYYAPEEDDDCSAYIPYLGDENKNFSTSLRYIVASGIIQIRRKMINFIEEKGLMAGSFISKHAYVSKMAKIGKGAIITPFSAIGGNPVIGDYILMNGGAKVGHHAILGDNIVIGPGAGVLGHCILGNDISLGCNACLIPGTVLGSGVEIGILTYPRKKVKAEKAVMSLPGEMIDKFRS